MQAPGDIISVVSMQLYCQVLKLKESFLTMYLVDYISLSYPLTKLTQGKNHQVCPNFLEPDFQYFTFLVSRGSVNNNKTENAFSPKLPE